MSFPIKIIILRGLFVTHFGATISSRPVQPGFFLKARLHDRKNWNGPDKKTNGSDKIRRVNGT